MLRSSFKHISAALLGTCLIAGQANAGIMLQDNFDTGQRVANGVFEGYWGGSVRTSVGTHSPGNYGLIFSFHDEANGDSFAEQRVRFPAKQQVWVSYDLFIPSNYYHRTQASNGQNNKFFAIFNNNYVPGFQVNFSMEPDGNGGSRLDIRFYDFGRERGNGAFEPSGGWPRIIDRNADLGKWMKIVMQFKVPTSDSVNDGVMKIWKNGTQLLNINNLNSHGTSGFNYMDQAYILGWSNSGFAQQTNLIVDNVVFSDEPLPTTGTTQEPVAPMPPSNFNVTPQ